jgi:hypothetical protein
MSVPSNRAQPAVVDKDHSRHARFRIRRIRPGCSNALAHHGVLVHPTWLTVRAQVLWATAKLPGGLPADLVHPLFAKAGTQLIRIRVN